MPGRRAQSADLLRKINAKKMVYIEQLSTTLGTSIANKLDKVSVHLVRRAEKQGAFFFLATSHSSLASHSKREAVRIDIEVLFLSGA